jgi:predicted restriction endonuclease
MKELRKKFREGVFNRDKYKCVFCNKTEDLDAHHIVNRKMLLNDGYAVSNGITLCKEHHWQAETGTIGIDELYRKINSSREKAIEDCKNL